MNPEDFISAYRNALSSQQWAQVQPLIHEQATVTFSSGQQHTGHEEIRAAYERNFSHIQNDTFQMFDICWLLKNNDVAVYTFKYEWTGIIHGELAGGRGYGLSIITSENNRWSLLAEQLTAIRV